MFSHILVPLDESRLAEHVLSHVRALAPLDHARVTLLNVLEPPSAASTGKLAEPVEWQLGLGRARSYLEGVKERLEDAGIQTQVELIEGDPTTSILEFARQNEVELIALTSHGAGGEAMHSLGEVALKTLFGARSNVLLVRSFNPVFPDGNGAPDEAPGYRKVLVPLDGSLRAESALPYAERICNASGGSIQLMSVASPLQRWNSVEEATTYLEDVGKGVSGAQRLAKSCVKSETDVVGAIDGLAIDEDVDIMVMSAHGASGGTRTPYGSVTLDLLVYGYSPLLVVQDRAAYELEETHAVRAAKEQQGHA